MMTHEPSPKIACLGWGSLIWDPRDLQMSGIWSTDGPLLPLEFARESTDKRITLVLVATDHLVRSLWAPMATVDLQDAKRQLAAREGISEPNIKNSVGFWDQETGDHHGRCIEQIAPWAEELGLDAVVWTNLKCGFKATRGQTPTYAEVLQHFESLQDDEQTLAEDYVRRAPRQVTTAFRRQLEADLGWTPIDTDSKTHEA